MREGYPDFAALHPGYACSLMLIEHKLYKVVQFIQLIAAKFMVINTCIGHSKTFVGFFVFRGGAKRF